MKLSIAEQRVWALGSTLVIVVVAVMALYEPVKTSSGSQWAAPADSGLTEAVLAAMHTTVPVLTKLVDG